MHHLRPIKVFYRVFNHAQHDSRFSCTIRPLDGPIAIVQAEIINVDRKGYTATAITRSGHGRGQAKDSRPRIGRKSDR